MHAVPRQVVEDVIEARPVHQRHERLRHRLGERAQSRALAADEHDGLHRAASRSLRATSSALARRASHAAGRRRAAPATRAVLAVVAVDAHRVHHVHAARPPRGDATLVEDLELGRVQDRPARVAQSRAQVELLRVEPEALVEPADLLERAPAHQQARPAHPVDDPLGPAVPPDLPVGARVPVRAEERAEEGVPDRLADAREDPAALVDRAVGVAHQRPEDGRVRMVLPHLDERCEVAGPDLGVGVEEQDPGRVASPPRPGSTPPTGRGWSRSRSGASAARRPSRRERSRRATRCRSPGRRARARRRSRTPRRRSARGTRPRCS